MDIGVWIARLVVALALCAGAWPAAAQPHSGAVGEETKQRARESFQRGLERFERGEWDPALAEFLRSRSLYATRSNTQNAAVCLAKLRRYDEALEMFHLLLSEFPDLADRAQVESEVRRLRDLVGTIEIRMTTPGASVLVDGRLRGTTPIERPIRVPSGSHVVRIFKAGAAPYEVRLEVAGGENKVLEPRLTVLTRTGQLKITERNGKSAEVVVDGVVVGWTPWEGALQPGSHAVSLRGAGNAGTPPVSAPVHRDRTTLLSLELQRLDCELRVEPMPLTSMLALDGVEVGRGFWEGRLGCGPHALEVAAEGFLTEKRRVILIRERPRVERVELERDPESSAWRKANPPRVFLDLAAYAAVAPTFSGDVSSSCRAGCERTLPVGGLVELMGGYQWSSGVGLSIGLGALALRANVAERAVVPHELPNDDPLAGIQSDRVTLTGLVIGAGAHVQRGESFPWMARVSGGVVLGSVDDRRSAEVDMGADGVHSYGPLSASFPARYAYVSTELRIGPRFRDFELALALRPMVLLALSQPTWDRRSERTNTRRPPGEPAVPLFRFDQETLSGSVLFLFAGGISARYSFL